MPRTISIVLFVLLIPDSTVTRAITHTNTLKNSNTKYKYFLRCSISITNTNTFELHHNYSRWIKSFVLCYRIFELALKIQDCINTLELVLQVCGGCRCDYDSLLLEGAGLYFNNNRMNLSNRNMFRKCFIFYFILLQKLAFLPYDLKKSIRNTNTSLFRS